MTADALSALRTSVRGALIGPGDGEYDDARALFNSMIDKRPALIARCESADDVAAALREPMIPSPMNPTRVATGGLYRRV